MIIWVDVNVGRTAGERFVGLGAFEILTE